MPFDNTKYDDLKVTIQKKVIPQLTLTEVTKGIDQRGYGSELEKQFTDTCEGIFENFKKASSVKSADDCTVDGIPIDVKTSDIDKKFKMPNMISLEVLEDKFWAVDILYSFIIYSSKQQKVLDSHLYYIWELPWKHLRMGNIGLGQLQIKNMKNFINDIDYQSNLSKVEWYREFVKRYKIFSVDLEQKIRKRREDFLKRNKEWVC